MTEAKRGRPRKNPVAIPFDKNLNVVNPDCEPATKGYVKRIARAVVNNTEHTHKTVGSGWGFFSTSTISMIISGILWAVAIRISDTAQYQTMLATIFWMSFIIWCGSLQEELDISSEYVMDKIPKSLKKYEPPEKTDEDCP
jgi:hypothetical protein